MSDTNNNTSKYDEEIMFGHEIDQRKEHMLKTLDECIERLKERKASLSKEFDDRLAEYKSYRDKVDTEVRKLENCRKSN